MHGTPADSERQILGISSGTSADGADLALIRSHGSGLGREVRFIAGATVAMPAVLQEAIRNPLSTAGLSRLHGELGRWFGETALSFMQDEGVAPEEVHAVGSHGQTVHHHDGDPRDGSLQLGDAAVLAHQLGISVVSDFRWTDLAAGGQGAPISPYADAVLHGREGDALAILNLGGLGNITLLQPGQEPMATDTGPANGPLDALMRFREGQELDFAGEVTAAGQPNLVWIEAALKDSFFSRPFPRSTGLERFGDSLAQRLLQEDPQATTPDLMATAALFAAQAVKISLDLLQAPSCKVFVAGGGVHNRGLIGALRTQLEPKYALRPYAELGWDPDLREAVAFALLADAFLLREPSSWPRTTGCEKPQVLGRWTPKPPS